MNTGQRWVAQACLVFSQQGQVLPTLFAQGPTRLSLATPAHDAEMTMTSQIVLLCLMAQAVEAIAVGTVHEAWTREFDEISEVQSLKPGDLEKLSEIDPLVRTAIVSTWGDLVTGRVFSEMATLGLDDFGEIDWDWSHAQEPEGDIAQIVRAVILAEGLPAADPETVAVAVGESMGWSVMLWGG
jgi:hypothetical protein